MDEYLQMNIKERSSSRLHLVLRWSVQIVHGREDFYFLQSSIEGLIRKDESPRPICGINDLQSRVGMSRSIVYILSMIKIVGCLITERK